MIRMSALDSSHAAQKLHPDHIADAIQLPNQNRPDSSGRVHMRAATRAAIKILNGDHSNRPGALGGLAKIEVRRRIREGHHHRTILKHNFVRAPFDRGHLIGTERRPRNVDSATPGAEMKADSRRAEEISKDRRKQMLAGMLLHVIEAARPVDLALNFVRHYRHGGYMRDDVLFVDYFENRRAAERANVKRLAAGSGIKSGSIEVDFAAIQARLKNTSPECTEIAVCVVKPFRHCAIDT